MKKQTMMLLGWFFLSLMPSGSQQELGPYLTEVLCMEIRSEYLALRGSSVLGATSCYLVGGEE